MELKIIDEEFSVCKVADYSLINLEQPYCFSGSTDEEKSLVCPSDKVPENILKCDTGWKAFRIQGILDFSLIGILSNISRLLAKNKISIFVVSTYNTDYIFIKKENFVSALNILSENGYEIR